MKPSTRQNADELGESISELWARFCIAEHDIPVLLGMPRSTWDVLKRQSSPKIFSLGKRNYVLVDDLKQWLRETRDSWEPKAPKRRLYRVGTGETG